MTVRDFMIRDGEKVAVIRPDDPARALRLAKLALEKQDVDAFLTLPGEAGSYTFQGFASRDARSILDSSGDLVGPVVVGDSFVGESDIEKIAP